MSHYKRNFKHILFVLFFHLLLLIYQCYGTELKCTCESKSATFCAACEENLDFYFHEQKSTNKHITNTEVGKKYKENTISPDIFYEEYKKKLSLYSHNQKVQTNMMQMSDFLEIIKACEENLSTDPHNQKRTNENDTNVEPCKKYQENEINPKTFYISSKENLNLYSHDQKDTNKTDANLELWEYVENSITSETFYKLSKENLNLYSHDQKFIIKDDANVELYEKHKEKSINPETVYEACEKNLSLYTHNQKNTNKCNPNDAICEKCEENSENNCSLKMDMKRQTLCARCSLEYLSYYFSRNPIESTKLYCVEIILVIISDNALREETKIVVSDLINNKFNNKFTILEERKKKNESCNLFPITNEILSQFKQKPLSRRLCANRKCMEAKFHLIEVPCCKQLICLRCICMLFETKQPKCIICENGYICRNIKEFEKTFKLIYFGFAEQAPKLITKEIQKEFDNAISKIRNSKKNGSIQYTQFAALTKKWLTPARKILLENQNLVPDESNNMIDLTKGEMLLVMVITIGPQIAIFVHIISFKQFAKDALWFFCNLELLSQLELLGTKKFLKNEKGKRILRASRDFALTWLNILFCYFVFGPKFYKKFTVILLNFVLIPSLLWPSLTILKYLDIFGDEDSYEFY